MWGDHGQQNIPRWLVTSEVHFEPNWISDIVAGTFYMRSGYPDNQIANRVTLDVFVWQDDAESPLRVCLDHETQVYESDHEGVLGLLRSSVSVISSIATAGIRVYH